VVLACQQLSSICLIGRFGLVLSSVALVSIIQHGYSVDHAWVYHLGVEPATHPSLAVYPPWDEVTSGQSV